MQRPPKEIEDKMALALTSGAAKIVGESGKDGGVPITTDPHQAQMLLLLGIVALRLGDLTEAINRLAPRSSIIPGA